MKSVRSCSLLVLLLLGSCSSAFRPLPEVADEINRSRDQQPFTIEPGDTIEMIFPQDAQLNHTTRVRPDGRASFWRIDEVLVQGMTVAQIDRVLTERYSSIQTGGAATINTEITISVIPGVETGADTREGLSIYVIGEVHEPGALSLAGRPMTLIEAIARAGGPLKESADLSGLVLVRRVPRQPRVMSWMIDASYEYWGTAAPVFLQPNDIVVIPNTVIDELNIIVDKYIRQMIPVPYLIPPMN